MERTRPEASVDKLRWYCKKGNHPTPTVVHEEQFHCTDLGTQIKQAVNNFKEDTQARTCKNCGEICDVAPRQMPVVDESKTTSFEHAARS